MFDFFIKRFLIIICTLLFNDNKHKLKILINIDAIDYAFIDKKIAQFVYNMLNMKFVFLLKSKSLIEFDDHHVFFYNSRDIFQIDDKITFSINRFFVNH